MCNNKQAGAFLTRCVCFIVFVQRDLKLWAKLFIKSYYATWGWDDFNIAWGPKPISLCLPRDSSVFLLRLHSGFLKVLGMFHQHNCHLWNAAAWSVALSSTLENLFFKKAGHPSLRGFVFYDGKPTEVRITAMKLNNMDERIPHYSYLFNAFWPPDELFMRPHLNKQKWRWTLMCWVCSAGELTLYCSSKIMSSSEPLTYSTCSV